MWLWETKEQYCFHFIKMYAFIMFFIFMFDQYIFHLYILTGINIFPLLVTIVLVQIG